MSIQTMWNWEYPNKLSYVYIPTEVPIDYKSFRLEYILQCKQYENVCVYGL